MLIVSGSSSLSKLAECISGFMESALCDIFHDITGIKPAVTEMCHYISAHCLTNEPNSGSGLRAIQRHGIHDQNQELENSMYIHIYT